MLHDDVVTGLHLRAFPKGKAWYLRYRTKTRIERKPKLGGFPDMPLEGARRAARAILELVAAGRDPGGEVAEKRRLATVADLCERYMDRWARKHKDPHSADLDDGMINRYIKPGLGKLKVAELKQSDVEDFLEKVLHRRIGEQSKHHHRNATVPYAANRVRALLSKMLNLSMTEPYGMRKPELGNPVKPTEKNTEKKRKRIAELHELQAIALALEDYRLTYPRQIAALWTIFFTGARKNEIAKARIDQRKSSHGIFQGDRLVLGEHKTDDEIGDKTIHLPVQVTEALNALTSKGDGYLFGKHNLNWVWNKVRKAAGCPDLTIHDVRRTYLSIAVHIGIDLTQVGKLVGHTNVETTNGYAWLLEENKRRLSQTIADGVGRLMLPAPAGQGDAELHDHTEAAQGEQDDRSAL